MGDVELVYDGNFFIEIRRMETNNEKILEIKRTILFGLEDMVMVKVSIVNVVATAALGQKVDLEELGKHGEILHDSEIYGGRVAYFSSPNVAGKVSIFASGKMISVGTKSEIEAFRALECAKGFLVEKGYVKPVVLEKLVQNIVAVADFE